MTTSKGKLETDAVMVYTGETLEELVRRGWTGNWVAGLERVRSMRWVVIVRSNGRTTRRHGHAARSAFLVGRICDVSAAAPPEVGRVTIYFDRYAEVFVPNAWTGSRNPIAYVRLDGPGLDVETLRWADAGRTDAVAEQRELRTLRYAQDGKTLGKGG